MFHSPMKITINHFKSFNLRLDLWTLSQECYLALIWDQFAQNVLHKIQVSILNWNIEKRIYPILLQVYELLLYSSIFSELFIKCLRKLRKEDSDYKNCFKQLLERDENREDDKKCATCVCKDFKNSGVDADAYPEVKDMFCFLGNRNLS